jgi:hypothetical protein
LISVVDDPIRRIGFAVIACGPYAQTCKAETFIESLCRIGGWQGPVFLYTERPQCFDIPQLRKVAGNDLIELVNIPDFKACWRSPVSIAWDGDGAVLWPRLRLRSAMVMRQAKSMKSRLFELLPRQDIEVLIYSDADSIVVRNDQMPLLLKLASEWTGEGIKCRLDERDPERPLDYTPSSQIHSGILILHRELSKRALEAWKMKLTSPKAWEHSPFDRHRYREAYDEVTCAGTEPNYMHVYVIPEDARIEGFSNMQRAHMIEHISFGRLRENGRKAVEDYVGSFDLKSYPRGYYFLGPTPEWVKLIFYMGFFPSKRVFKIEHFAKKIFG